MDMTLYKLSGNSTMTGYCLVPHVNLTDANEQVANIVLSLLSNG